MQNDFVLSRGMDFYADEKEILWQDQAIKMMEGREDNDKEKILMEGAHFLSRAGGIAQYTLKPHAEKTDYILYDPLSRF
jgi:hypothetical protein